MPQGQKHHYIPIFYLKQWARPDGRLCEFSQPRDSVKTRFVHPAGTGYVRGLYETDSSDPNKLNAIEEQVLKPHDGMAAEALQCLVRDIDFTHDRMRQAWTQFLLSLVVRYPEAVANMKKVLAENVERMYQQTRKPEDPETLAEYEAKLGTAELGGLYGRLIQDLIRDDQMGRHIYYMQWGAVSFLNCKHQFLTSDRPIVSNQFGISAVHMALPISPTRLFFATATQQAEVEFRRIDPLRVMNVMNDAVVRRARTYVWASDDTQLRFVENRLGKARTTQPDGIDRLVL